MYLRNCLGLSVLECQTVLYSIGNSRLLDFTRCCLLFHCLESVVLKSYPTLHVSFMCSFMVAKGGMDKHSCRAPHQYPARAREANDPISRLNLGMNPVLPVYICASTIATTNDSATMEDPPQKV